MKEWAPLEVEFYKKNYHSASKGNYDIYVVFVEKGMDFLNEKGLLGYILPHKFFNAKYGQPLRSLIANGKNIDKIVHFGDQQVFEKATTYTCLLFLNKSPIKKLNFVNVEDLTDWKISKDAVEGEVSAGKVTDEEWNFIVGPGAVIFDKLNEMPIKLKDITNKIFQGLVTGADGVFILKNVDNDKYASESLDKEVMLEEELIHPLCKGSVNLKRYHVAKLEKSILFPYRVQAKATLLSKEELAENYPKTWKYLLDNRQKLESRERGKWKHDKWYAFGRTQNMNEMEQMKIMTPSIANSASFSLDSSNFYYFVGSGGGGGGGYGITLLNEDINEYKYILGLLNSKLLDLYLQSYSSTFRGGYYAYNKQYIEKLPIRTINFEDSEDVARHDRMVNLVEQMLQLHKDIESARTPQDKELIRRQIDATDKQINTLVYELYGLTEDEIRILGDR